MTAGQPVDTTEVLVEDLVRGWLIHVDGIVHQAGGRNDLEGNTMAVNFCLMFVVNINLLFTVCSEIQLP